MDNSSWLPQKTVQTHGFAKGGDHWIDIGQRDRDIGAPFAWFAMQRLSYCIDVRCHVAWSMWQTSVWFDNRYDLLIFIDLMFDDVHRIIENCRDTIWCHGQIEIYVGGTQLHSQARVCLVSGDATEFHCHQAPKMLPVEFGIWKTRFCDFQPATLTAVMKGSKTSFACFSLNLDL